MKDEEKNPLDELFSKKLNEGDLPPDEKLWGEIEQRMGEQKDRRRPFLILFSLMVLLLIFGLTSYLIINNNSLRNNTSNEVVAGNNSKQKNAITETNKTKANALEDTSDEKLNKTNIAGMKAAIPPAKIEAGKSNANVIAGTTKNSIPAANGKSKKGIPKQSYTTITKGSTHIISNSISNTPVSADSISNAPIVKPANAPGRIAELNNETKDTTSKPVSNETHLSTKEGVSNSGMDRNNKDASKTTDTAAKQKVITNIVKKDTVATQPSEKKSRVKWYAEAGIDLMNNTKQIKAPASADPYYLQKRDGQETSTNTLNYTLKAGAQFGHVQFESGFTLYRTGENIQYDNRAICYNLVSAGHYNGSTYIYKYDTINYHLEKNDSVTKKNGRSVNTYVGIPVQVLYNFKIKGVKLQVGGGITGLISEQWNSLYINTQAISLENPSTEKMLSPILFDANITAGAVIPLNDHFDLVASLAYRRNLNSVFKSAYGVQQEYSGIGLGLSVRYNFGIK